MKKPDDLMFNGYEDSVEDEKANQEAFERSLNFSDESKENRFKKLSFLTNRTVDEAEDEFPLVRPVVNNNNEPPKIEIEGQFLKNSPSSEEGKGSENKEGSLEKSVIGKYLIFISIFYIILDLFMYMFLLYPNILTDTLI